MIDSIIIFLGYSGPFRPLTSLPIILLTLLTASCGLFAPFSGLPEEDTAEDTGSDDIKEDDAVEDTGSDYIEEDNTVEDMDVVEGESIECTGTRDCTDGDPCNGYETCDEDTGTCVSGAPLADGALCGTGDPRMICVSEECIESTCGDGYVDTGAGESCEPPGGENCNDECQRVCDGNEDCPDDGNPCNGTEYCDMDAGTCRSRDPLEEGEQCDVGPRKICLSAACNESICGDGWTDAVRGEECDDGNEDEDDGCEPGTCLFSCHAGDPCDDGRACTDDACDSVTTHMCQHTVADEGKECRPVAGPCDVAEACNGTDRDCPTDMFKADGTSCRAAEGPCDVAEHCPGTGPACPEDAGLDAGTECDDGEKCTFPDECNAGGDCVGEDRGLSDAMIVSAGVNHTCALLLNGEIWCWGADNTGQLGDGEGALPSPVPVQVELGYTASTISAGGNHTCAVLDSGRLVCWGLNDNGQIGDGTMDGHPTPVEVPGIAGAIAVTCGLLHTCVLFETGAMKCWGDNAEGQLGNGDQGNDSHSPVDVTGLSTGVAAIAAGGRHTCAAKGVGEIYCWGKNNRGQVGDDSTTNRDVPVLVETLGSGATAAVCGIEHTCALLDTGGVQCWGRNDQGQIGNTGAGGEIHVPIHVTGLTSDVASITAGQKHTCAITTAGSAKCWGLNDHGQIGDGSTVNRVTPFNVSGMAAGVVQIDAGWEHTCAVLERGVVMCWGSNEFGQVGNGLLDGLNKLFPVNVTCISEDE